ncbi:MAG: hypothetical protein M1816_004209 [Peltula sp. TS41687]|nr:MAG: hypothetical protein M1816_004209 [Peltula sp. TS41687]
MSSVPASPSRSSSSPPPPPAMEPDTEKDTDTDTDYTQWPPSRLISRINELEFQLKALSQSPTPTPVPTQYTNNNSNHRHSHQQRRAKKTQLLKRGAAAAAAATPRPIDPAKYSTRYIALRLAYLGQNYNGFEYHPNCPTPLPTIEEVLWRALRMARLIFPSKNTVKGNGAVEGREKEKEKEEEEEEEEEEINWEGCEYSKCGRTDKGVSAFGQVVGIRVRSNRPLVVRGKGRKEEDDKEVEMEEMVNGYSAEDDTPLGTIDSSLLDEDGGEADPLTSAFDPIKDEIPYPYILNRILPEDIRVLAWCPSPPPNFSARFSCRERQYRYFFTQPAYAPIGGLSMHVDGDTSNRPSSSPGWLDLEAMRKAARSFIGQHDFRNFCKVDPSKQITSFERRIYHAEVIELGPPRPDNRSDHNGNPLRCISNPPRICAFVVHGSAFLWHQVRQMVAILFLIGQGLESPSLVSELLDVERHPCRPLYEMADDAPLVLWDCIFSRSDDDDDPERKDALEWVYAGDRQGEIGRSGSSSSSLLSGKYGRDGLMEELWRVWRRRKMDEILMGSLLDIVAGQGRRARLGGQRSPFLDGVRKNSPQVFAGGNTAKATGSYIPVMERRTLETVEEINRRYFRGKDRELEGRAEEQQGQTI